VSQQSRRRYTRISPANYPVMVRLHEEYGLTYAQIADLYGCSRSRVVQLVSENREEVAA
jgi:DNA-directed RNA polymerase specialized sigma24 family protein